MLTNENSASNDVNIMEQNSTSFEETDVNGSAFVKSDEVTQQGKAPIRGAQKRKRRSVYPRTYIVDKGEDVETVLQKQEAKDAEVKNKRKNLGTKGRRKKLLDEDGKSVSTRRQNASKSNHHAVLPIKKRRAKARANDTITAACKQILRPNKSNVKSLSAPVKAQKTTAKGRKRVNKDTNTDKEQLENDNKGRGRTKAEKSNTTKEDQQNEMKFALANIDDTTCKVCSKTFKLRSSALRHVRLCHFSDDKEHKCDICNISYKNKMKLRTHFNCVHQHNYLCETCGKNFHQQSHFQMHMYTRHANVNGPSLKCDIEGCDKTFHYESNKRRHINSVHIGERKYPCSHCTQKFKTSGALKNHLYTIHTADKDKRQFPCFQCRKVFHSLVKLKYHRTIHLHASDAKKFACSFDGCNAKFRLKDSLNKHAKVHANYKPFVCDVCQQAFSRRSYLETHQYKHTGVKQYQCEICNKSFSQKGNLTVHMRLHSDKTTEYSCEICSRTFNFKSNFTKHLKSHEDGTFENKRSSSRQLNTRSRKISSDEDDSDLDEDELFFNIKAKAAADSKRKRKKSYPGMDGIELVSGNRKVIAAQRKKVAVDVSTSTDTCIGSSQSRIWYIIDQKLDETKSIDHETIDQQASFVTNDEDETLEKKVFQIPKDEGLNGTDEKSDLPAEVIEAIRRQGISFDDAVNVTYINEDGESNIITVQPDVLRGVLEGDGKEDNVADETNTSVKAENASLCVKREETETEEAMQIQMSNQGSPVNLTMTSGYVAASDTNSPVTKVVTLSSAFALATTVDAPSFITQHILTDDYTPITDEYITLTEGITAGSSQECGEINTHPDSDRTESEIQNVLEEGNRVSMGTVNRICNESGNQIPTVAGNQSSIQTGNLNAIQVANQGNLNAESQITMETRNQTSIETGHQFNETRNHEDEEIQRFEFIPAESEIVVMTEPEG